MSRRVPVLHHLISSIITFMYMPFHDHHISSLASAMAAQLVVLAHRLPLPQVAGKSIVTSILKFGLCSRLLALSDRTNFVELKLRLKLKRRAVPEIEIRAISSAQANGVPSCLPLPLALSGS